MGDLVKKTMTNTGDETRRWDSLQRTNDKIDDEGRVVVGAGSTLELDPGEQADVMVPEDFEDPWLKEAKVGSPKKNVKKESGTSEA